MLQKEVVARFLAQPKTKQYGIPTIKLAWCCDVLGHFWVKPGSFSPPPKVDSGVFWFRRSVTPMANPKARNESYDLASALVEKVFQQRRKMLRGSLAFLSDHVWGSKRPEELSAQDFLILFDLEKSQQGLIKK